MVAFTPSSLGLPQKFTDFRDMQVDAINQIVATDKRFIIVQGPPGSGKTAIAAAVQRILNTRMLYQCTTKQLQDQFQSDFAVDRNGNRWSVDLKGRANYPVRRFASKFPYLNASLCTKRREKHCRWCCTGHCNPDINGDCTSKHSCPYELQKYKCLHSRLAVVNTSLFINEANYVGRFSDWPFVVLDEADLSEQELLGFISVEITRTWINKLGIEPPKLKTVQKSWEEWVRDTALPAVAAEADRLSHEYGVEDMRRMEQIERMEHKLTFFLNESTRPDKRWVFESSDDRWTFKPVYVDDYAQHYLWRHGKRWMLMSGTIISVDEMCRTLGIPRGDVCFIDIPSSFPAARRPVYYIPAANMTNKTKELEFPKLVKAVDEILDKYPRQKTLIHTVSYVNAANLVKMSKHEKRMMTYTVAGDRSKVLDMFRLSANGTVLVASSMDRGIDLPGELLRMVLITKVPFANLGDKQTSARLYSDKRHGRLWYAVNTIRTLIQMSGRGMRSSDDYAITYILDEQFGRLYEEYKNLFPKWWREALHMKL